MHWIRHILDRVLGQLCFVWALMRVAWRFALRVHGRPFAVQVVAGKLKALQFLLQHIVYEVLTVVSPNPKAKDCDMAVMNHVLHSRVIPGSDFRIYTGLPLIKDPQLRRIFKQGQSGPAMVNLHKSTDRWLQGPRAPPRPHFANSFALQEPAAACGNCSRLLEDAARQARPALVEWSSPKWSAPAHCVMLTYAPADWDWNITVPPKWGALVIFHEGTLTQRKEAGDFDKASVKLVDVRRDDFCRGCSASELQWFLFYAYLERSPLMYAVIIERLVAINRKDSNPCDFVKQSRHFKFLNKISVFTGGRTLPLHYTPVLERGYDCCYQRPLDGKTAFVYDPVLVAGFTANVVQVLRRTLCEVLCRLNVSAATCTGLAPAICFWPAFNHVVHDEKKSIKVGEPPPAASPVLLQSVTPGGEAGPGPCMRPPPPSITPPPPAAHPPITPPPHPPYRYYPALLPKTLCPPPPLLSSLPSCDAPWVHRR